MEDHKMRIDKWLWTVRVFKTRSKATEACRRGRVSIEGTKVKASREVKIGEKIDVRIPPITRSYLVKAISKRRMGAKLVVDFMDEVTTQDQLDLWTATQNYNFEKRRRGTGRPTKYERRMLGKLKKL